MSEAKELGMRIMIERLEKMLGNMQLPVLNVTKTTDNTRAENNILTLVIRSLARTVSVAC